MRLVSALSFRCFQLCSIYLTLLFLVATQAVVAQDNLTPQAIIDWIEGSYSNQAQITAGDLDAVNNLLYPVFKQVDIPAFGPYVVYLQWPIGAPDGELQRQRIWTFQENEMDGVSMGFFTLREPERWLDAHLDPNKVLNMTSKDAIGYPDVCLLPVTTTGEVINASIPTDCQIVSQATRTTMTLQANISITPNRITYSEGGIRQDESVVFKVPPSGHYIFDRIAD